MGRVPVDTHQSGTGSKNYARPKYGAETGPFQLPQGGDGNCDTRPEFTPWLSVDYIISREGEIVQFKNA